MSENIKIRIVGGPTTDNISITDAETGKVIRCRSIKFNELKPGELLTAVVEVFVDEIDVVADVN